MKKPHTGHPDDPPATPPNSHAPLKFTFVMHDTDHLFVGIVFTKRNTTPGGGPIPRNDDNFRGKRAFPKIEISEFEGYSQLSFINTRDQKASYDYSILVQEIESGEIGCIDPEFENEN